MKHGLNTEIKASGEQLMNESFSLAHPCFIRVSSVAYFCFSQSPLTIGQFTKSARTGPKYEIHLLCAFFTYL